MHPHHMHLHLYAHFSCLLAAGSLRKAANPADGADVFVIFPPNDSLQVPYSPTHSLAPNGASSLLSYSPTPSS
jgi:hypothetical protein